MKNVFLIRSYFEENCSDISFTQLRESEVILVIISRSYGQFLYPVIVPSPLIRFGPEFVRILLSPDL